MNRNGIKWRMGLLFTLLAALALNWQALSQEVVSYSTTEGLAHSDVRFLLNDPDGWLWIGTWDGLSRYDGHIFQNYRHIPGDSTSLQGNQIEGIEKDQKGFIWILSRAGGNIQLARYNPQTDNFSRLKLSIDPRRHFEGGVDLVFDHLGNGWFVSDEGLFWFDPVSFSIRFVDISDFHRMDSRLAAGEEGLWIAASGGLFLFSYDSLMQRGKVTIAEADVNYQFEVAGYDFSVGELVRMQNGLFLIVASELDKLESKLYISSPDCSFTIKELPLPRFHQPPKTPRSLFLSKIAPNKILVSTNYPAFAVFDADRMEYAYDHHLSEYFTYQIHKVAYPDHHNNLWVGKLEGMIRYSPPQLNLRSWVFDPAENDGLSGRKITALHKDNQNRLWVGSVDGGLESVNLSDNKVTKIIPTEFEHHDLKTDKIFSIIPLNDEEALINYGSSLFRYHLTENRFSFFRAVDFIVYTHFVDSRNRLWISERGKVSAFSRNDLSLIYEFYGVDFCNSATNSRQIYEARNGQFWVCCGEGLVRLNHEAPNKSVLFVPPGSESAPEVICMHERADGSFWLGTLRHGIYAFDPVTGEFKAQFSNQNGLIDNSVNKIYEDKNGYLWMSTWKGIARLNTADSSITNFSVANGLPFPEFNTNAHIMTEDGTIYFGGEGGVIAFHPDSLVNFEIKTRPGVTAINSGFGLLPLDYPLRDGAVVKLAYNNNAFSVAFSAFDFRRPEQRMYRFRLAGHSDSWQVVRGNDLTAHFAGLKPGDYTFELQSTYKGWPWILESANIAIIISAPPFYLSGTFRIIVALLAALALLAVAFLLFRNFKIRKEVQISHLENESNQAKLNFLKTQMNPHSYFNTLNAINSYILDNDIRSANKYLATFSRLMRDILENSQKDFITVDRECEVLEKYLKMQQLRFPELFDFTISRDEEVGMMHIPPMIVQPFVENSVEYAFIGANQRGIIHVKFEKSNGSLLCEVLDNGIGIEKSQEIKTATNRKSTAINNINRRIEILQNIYHTRIDLKITPAFPENRSNPGARVILKLPDFRNRTAPAR